MKSNKKTFVLRSNAGSEYKFVVELRRKFVWIKDILIEMSFISKTSMRLYCDNLSAIYIVQNLEF